MNDGGIIIGGGYTIEMTKQQFNAGDVVRLKSGGVNMTVSSVEGDDVYVTWMDGQKLQQGMIKRVMLTTAPTLADRLPRII